MTSLRDLGTCMQNLQVLWISRSGICDISGINALPLLRELYACYNSLSEINDLYYNQTIEVLDLEGNDIEDMEAIGVLETMEKL